ncbi:MAG: SDR family oxidoreductase [Thermocladium sp.]
MDLGLTGKNVLVTASSKGIGLGVAKVMAMEGANVMLFARKEEELREARQEIMKISKGRVEYYVGDISNKDDVAKLIDETNKSLGGVDILVYNTAPPKPGTFLQLSDDDWEYGSRLLLQSAVWLTRRVVNNMMKNGWGRLIYITSLTLKQQIPNLVLSNVIRLSIMGLVKSLAVELAPYGITSNGIMQGHIFTERTLQLASDSASRQGKSIDDVLKDMAKEIPAGRYGTPEEVGNLAAFLASNKASYINGAMILIDGGLVRCT